MVTKKARHSPKESYADMVFNKTLAEIDEVAKKLADLEQARQNNKLIMIASEAMCPKPVREALSSTYTNLYAEGYPRRRMLTEERKSLEDLDRQMMLHRRFQDRRYYKGCDYINMTEALACRRVAEVFATEKTPADRIFANVQPHSGATANNEIYEAFLKPGDVVMGMALSSGGHLTHGSRANRSGKHYKIVSYDVDLTTGKVDYEKVRQLALQHKPRMIIGGYSAHTWDVDWKRLREIADEVGDCFVHADISHIAGLIAGGMLSNPIDYAQTVVFTTQKTLCGPRGAVILTTEADRARKIDSAVFPGEQSGAHFNNILAKAVCFEIAKTDAFKALQRQIVRNAQALAKELKRLGMTLAYGGTENHIVLISLRELKQGGFNLTGEVASRILDLCGITCNKNEISGDETAVNPSAIRLGTTWITQKGLKEEHMVRLARIIHSVLTGITPFEYIGTSKDAARGKITFDRILKARKGVAELVAEMDREGELMSLDYPHYTSAPKMKGRTSPLFDIYKSAGAKFVERNGWKVPKEVSGQKDELKASAKRAILVDSSDIPAIEVSGEKSTDFLQGTLTKNVYGLRENDGLETAILDPDGGVMAAVALYRLENGEHGPRYLLAGLDGFGDEVKDWLGALSDGYTRHDIDVFMKVEGPVMVRDISAGDGLWAAFDVAGKGAAKVVGRVAGRLPDGGSPWLKHFNYGGNLVELMKLSKKGEPDRFRLCGSGVVIARIFQKIISLDGGKVASPAGVLARDTIVGKQGIAVGGKVAGHKLLKRRPDLFDVTKPYFVGVNMLKIKDEARPVVFTEPKPKEGLKKSFLLDVHRELYPSVAIHPFAGWEMPVVFESIRTEHENVRANAGMFDLSHMGIFELTGPYAARFIDIIASNYLKSMHPGHSHYSYILDAQGQVLDDVFVYRLGEERFIIVANAANSDKIEKWLDCVNGGKISLNYGGRKVTLEDRTKIRNLKDPQAQKDRKMIIALQGPKSREMLSQVVTKDHERFVKMKKFEVGEFSIKGIPCILSRTGYTGEEIGYEIFVHPEKAAETWKLLLGLGAKPAGLGARDSTRTEAGLPLYGHELAGPDGISPIEVGYGMFVKLHKPFFIGRDEMVRQAINRKRQVVRFKVDKKGARVIRRGDTVATKDGEIIGEVTSSVVVGTVQVGLALLSRGRVASKDPIMIGLTNAMSEQDRQKLKAAGKMDPSIYCETGMVLPRFPPRLQRGTVWH